MKTILEKMVKLHKGLNVFVPRIDEMPSLDLSSVDPTGVHCTVASEAEAIRLYDQYEKICLVEGGTRPHRRVVMERECFGLTLINRAEDKEEMVWMLSGVKSGVGAAIVSFSGSPYGTVEEMCAHLRNFGHLPIMQVYEAGTLYVVFTRVFTETMKYLQFIDPTEKALESVLDIGLINKGDVWIKHNVGWSAHFFEIEETGWKKKFFEEEIAGARDSLIAKTYKEKFKGQPILKPNAEQSAVLMASGRFNGLIVTEDGRQLVVKGTEIINKINRTKRSLNDEPEAVRVIDQKSAAIVALDVVKGCYMLMS